MILRSMLDSRVIARLPKRISSHIYPPAYVLGTMRCSAELAGSGSVSFRAIAIPSAHNREASRCHPRTRFEGCSDQRERTIKETPTAGRWDDQSPFG